MYLSRILLDTSRRTTQLALASPSKFHGAIEEAFPEKQERNLWRIDTLQGKTYLLLLSTIKPELSKVAKQFGYSGVCGESKEYEKLLNRISDGSLWQFRLVANPTHSIRQENGRGKVLAHSSEKYQREWLEKQAEKKGFSLVANTLLITGSDWKIFYKRNRKQTVRIREVAFEGLLKVEQAELFKKTLIMGIGREKAYGMGLMTIVRAEGRNRRNGE